MLLSSAIASVITWKVFEYYVLEASAVTSISFLSLTINTHEALLEGNTTGVYKVLEETTKYEFQQLKENQNDVFSKRAKDSVKYWLSQEDRFNKNMKQRIIETKDD
jgi:hypothetical protein